MSACICNKCGRRMWELYARHLCPPLFEVVDAENPDWIFAYEYYANDEKEAAKEAAKCLDRKGDGPTERLLLVRKKGVNEYKAFDISFEYVLSYRARLGTHRREVCSKAEIDRVMDIDKHEGDDHD